MLIFFLLNKLYISLALCDLFTHIVCHDTMYRIRSVSFDIYAPISYLTNTYLCSLQISRTHLLYIYIFHLYIPVCIYPSLLILSIWNYFSWIQGLSFFVSPSIRCTIWFEKYNHVIVNHHNLLSVHFK